MKEKKSAEISWPIVGIGFAVMFIGIFIIPTNPNAGLWVSAGAGIGLLLYTICFAIKSVIGSKSAEKVTPSAKSALKAAKKKSTLKKNKSDNSILVVITMLVGIFDIIGAGISSEWGTIGIFGSIVVFVILFGLFIKLCISDLKKHLILSVIWGTVLFIALFFIDAQMNFFIRFFASYYGAAFLIRWFEAGCPSIDIPKSQKTGLSSCRKCGYLGADFGNYCPKCGWNVAESIYTDTKVVSCRKCGYLGAGAGNSCPKCGWNLVDIVRK